MSVRWFPPRPARKVADDALLREAARRPQELPIYDPDTKELLGFVHQDLEGDWVGGRAPRHRDDTRPYAGWPNHKPRWTDS